eukprot:scaffold24251_cov40-Attheya_sp.AAC.1
MVDTIHMTAMAVVVVDTVEDGMIEVGVVDVTVTVTMTVVEMIDRGQGNEIGAVVAVEIPAMVAVAEAVVVAVLALPHGNVIEDPQVEAMKVEVEVEVGVVVDEIAVDAIEGAVVAVAAEGGRSLQY